MRLSRYKIQRLTICLGAILAAADSAVAQSSSDYAITVQSIDSGGARPRSTTYSLRGSALGGSGVASSVTTAGGMYTRKPGFVGQLYRLTGLEIAANSLSVDEGTACQLQIIASADDNTIFAPLDSSSISWSILDGPLTSISDNGVATAGRVYENSPAKVAATVGTLAAELELTVLNISTDDFGSYAGDGIDDDWQVQYFGQPPNANASPEADADGTGQTNLFKFLAGVNPLDGSRFSVSIERGKDQDSAMNVIFSPIATGRIYTVQFKLKPADDNWNPLLGATATDNGFQRTVTDSGAMGPQKFYRVQITNPSR